MMLDMFALNPTGYAGIFSCFVTMMLSTTRALALAKPLYVIKKHLVRRAFFTFTALLILLLAVKDTVVYYHYQFRGFSENSNIRIATTAIVVTELFIIISIVVVVIISSIVSVKALRKENSALNGQRNNNGNNRSASKMIVTLSITFIIQGGPKVTSQRFELIARLLIT